MPLAALVRLATVYFPRALLAGLLAGGIAGCTWIIGDIPVPDAVTVDADAIAGAWYVYGLSADGALEGRLDIAADGQITVDGQTTQGTVNDALWQLDLGEGIGRVSGRFDARAGVGLMVQSRSADPAVFAVLIREPALRGTLLGGRTVQLELTEAGSPLAEFARLQRSQDEVYRQTERQTLVEDRLDTRQVTVVSEGEDAPRWIVRFDDDADWLLSPLLSGDGAIGVLRSANGSPRGPVLVWRDPVSPALPDRELFCAGLTVEDGEMASRMRSARIQNDRVDWSDGRRGAPSTVDGAAVLEGDGSFYDDQGTLVLPDAQGRLFALLPLVPRPGDAPSRSWGMALCLGLDAEGPAVDLGVDAAPTDMGVADAEPADAALGADSAGDPTPDVGADDAAASPDAAWDMASGPDAAP